jgi:hypothetical protein
MSLELCFATACWNRCAGSFNDNNGESTTHNKKSLLSCSLLPSWLLLLILLLLQQTDSKVTYLARLAISDLRSLLVLQSCERSSKESNEKEIRYSRWKIGQRFSPQDTHVCLRLSLAKASELSTNPNRQYAQRF